MDQLYGSSVVLHSQVSLDDPESTPRNPGSLWTRRCARVITTRSKLMVAKCYQVSRVALCWPLPSLTSRRTYAAGLIVLRIRVAFRPPGSLSVVRTRKSSCEERGRSHRSVHFKCRSVIVYPAGSELACGFHKSGSGHLFSFCDDKHLVGSIVLEWQKRTILPSPYSKNTLITRSFL